MGDEFETDWVHGTCEITVELKTYVMDGQSVVILFAAVIAHKTASLLKDSFDGHMIFEPFCANPASKQESCFLFNHISRP